jgi:cell division protein FtsW
LLLVALPAVALGALGAVVVASATARQGAATFGDPAHFAVRQFVALALAVVVALAAVRAGPQRLLAAAPAIFVGALVAALAVFVPGIGVRAAGASRWLRVGPLSGSPAPLLIAAIALLTAAWGRLARPASAAASAEAGAEPAHAPRVPVARRPLAVALGLLAVLALVAEPDFSAAAVALVVIIVALAGVGIGRGRLALAALALLVMLGVVASRFGYVGGRVHGFLAPERDRRGAGYEVLALARAAAGSTPGGVGLGRGTASHRLSSPGSDYVFAVVTEEMGKVAAGGVVAAWLAIGAGVVLIARRRRDRRLRAATLAAGAALLAPVALHIAVCRGWLPIIGVTMPLVSYDPAATVAAGAELGLVAAVALAGASADPEPDPDTDPDPEPDTDT